MGSIDTLREIPQAYRRIGRLRHIVHVLFRYGFGSVGDLLRGRFSRVSRRFLRFRSSEPAAEFKEKSVAERVRLALSELGPTFVKLGQILATRQDIIPPAFVEELSKLQDNVPPFPMSEVRALIKDELGGEIEELFSEFDETPVGAASMAQGHRARLKNGNEVFLKLQRPGISKMMKLDLELLRIMAEALERHSKDLAALHPVRIADEFMRSLEQELDFTHERANQERFIRGFANHPGVHIPAIIPEYCTKRILCMEFIRGIKGTNVAKLRASGLDLVAISHLAADALLEQFFEMHFFHGDPHPGNIFFLETGELCYIDFGQCCRVTENERNTCAYLMQHVILKDYKACASDLLELTDHDGEPNMEELERGIGEFVETYLHVRLNNLDVSAVIKELYNLCRREKLSLKPQFYLLLKALGVSDKLGQTLNPDFEILQQIRPYVVKLAMQRMAPQNVGHDVMMYGMEVVSLLKDYPKFLRQLNQQALDGRLVFNVKTDSLENMNRVFDSVFNRLACAIILASMIIGSSIVIHANPELHWYDTSIVGVLGFVMSGVFGIVLLVSIWQHRAK